MEPQIITVLFVLALVIGFFVWRSRNSSKRGGRGGDGSGEGRDFK